MALKASFCNGIYATKDGFFNLHRVSNENECILL